MTTTRVLYSLILEIKEMVRHMPRDNPLRKMLMRLLWSLQQKLRAGLYLDTNTY